MNWIQTKLDTFGSRIACHEVGRSWTYQQLNECIDILKALLPSKRCVIAIQTETSIEGLAALFAICDTQHIALPLPLELPEVEQHSMLAVTGATHRLSGTNDGFQIAELETSNRPALYEQLNQSGLVLFSSGTSGEPKAMLHDLPALLNRYTSVRPRDDRSLLLLLIDHIGGLDSAFRTLLSGSTLIVPKTRTPDHAGAAIAEHSVNVLPASPTFLNLMLLAQVPTKYDCSSLEIIAYGAEAMSAPLLQRVNAAFPNADIQQKFGTSETGTIRIKSTDTNSLFFKIEDHDTEWKIVDEALWLKTPSRILGYLNADESSLEADGWYSTGDLVEEGEDGSIRIIGRESALINVGGQKVHPGEIEAVLHDISEIESCHVSAKPDPITGSAITCEIISQADDDVRTWKRRIRNHCRGKLAPWKIPSHVSVTKELHANSRLKKDSSENT
ncbi:MAG: class I adenylate-forming enzyme family protein [Opitutaceae bacterium]